MPFCVLQGFGDGRREADHDTEEIEVVVPSLPNGGGVLTMARFIFHTLSDSEEFEADYISLAS